MTEEQIKKCNQIADHYGKSNQTVKFVEECAEAITAIQKLQQVDNSVDCAEAYENLWFSLISAIASLVDSLASFCLNKSSRVSAIISS